jgi:hypothetical protein
MRVLPYFAPTQRSNNQAVMNADGPLLVRQPQLRGSSVRRYKRIIIIKNLFPFVLFTTKKTTAYRVLPYYYI